MSSDVIWDRTATPSGGGGPSLFGLRRNLSRESAVSQVSHSSQKDGRDKQLEQEHDVIASLKHLTSFVDVVRMPFLAKQDLPTAIIEPHEILEGKLLGEDDFSRTYEIKGFKFSKRKRNRLGFEEQRKSKKNRNVYALKRLYIKPVPEGQDGGLRQDTLGQISADFEVEAKELILECMYLSCLSHPFILAFRGFFLKSKAAFNNHQQGAFHLVTDRLGETLEQRMNAWRDDREKRSKENPTERFISAALRVDLGVSYSTSLNMHKSFKDDNIHGAKEMIYPKDLVALQANYALQIAHALEYLHERGIVVHDLRPGTIGFKYFPNQHTIQLFRFGLCRELPTNGTLLRPNGVSVKNQLDRRGMSKDTKINGAGLSKRGGLVKKLSVYGGFRRTSTPEPISENPRSVAEHYRAPETFLYVPYPRNATARESQLPKAPLPEKPVFSVTVTNLTNPKAAPTRVTLPVTTTTQQPNNVAPERKEPIYSYVGYNCKSDIYSWAIIFYEMLAGAKPYDDSTLLLEEHYHRVQSQGLRPSFERHHFPRTIKVLLEQAWHPEVEIRLSSTQVRHRLSAILQILECKKVPIVLSAVTTDVGSAASGSSAGTINSEDQQQQDPLDQLNYLPNRAHALLIGANRQDGPTGGGWSSVWNPRVDQLKKLDSKKVMDAIQDRRVFRNKIPGGTGSKKKKKTGRAISYRDFLPNLMAGMVEDELNVAAANRLLGGNYKMRKKG
jgi:serine/threonine protein kinase